MTTIAANALLLVRIDVPVEIDEEFNAWYDTEHIPERLAVPGFLRARRFSRSDAPRYLALYDVDQPEVFDSEAYCVYFEGRRRTVWTARMGSKFHSVDRRVYRLTGVERNSAASDGKHVLVCSVAASEPDENRTAIQSAYTRTTTESLYSSRIFDGIPPNSEFARNLANRKGHSGTGERMLLCTSNNRGVLEAIELGNARKNAWIYDQTSSRTAQSVIL